MGDASSQMMVSSRCFLTLNTSNTGAAVDATERLRVLDDGNIAIGQTTAYSATGGGNTKLTVSHGAASRSDIVVSNQNSGDNAGAALVLATHGQDYIIEATGSGNSTDGASALHFTKSSSKRMSITSGGDIEIHGGDIFLNSGTSYNDKGVVYSYGWNKSLRFIY